MLRLTDTASGEPLAGAIIEVPSALMVFDTPVPYDIRLGPTDSSGRTWLNLILGPDFRQNYNFPALVEYEGDQEELAIQAKQGYLVQGDRFTLEVVQLGQEPPPIPQPQVVIGSNPPNVVLRGYVNTIVVTSSQCSESFFWLYPEVGLPLYLEDFRLGASHPGRFTGGILDQRCYSETVGSSAPVRVRVWLSESEPRESDPFCISEDNTAIICP